jgi:hypothetical protein
MLSPNTKTLFNAMSTPLASIFGSGFLVIVPILASAVAGYSALAMVGICIFAYLAGEVIRFNISRQHLENSKITQSLESLSELVLVFAYIVSVCLYLHIMSSFFLSPMGIENHLNEDISTTTVIVIITLIGLVKGLNSLESLEILALWCTLIIISVLIVAYGFYDINQLMTAVLEFPEIENQSAWGIATVLGGTLIVVQGFEAPRYMGERYAADIRIRASRYSQWIASTVYIVFVALAAPLVIDLQGDYSGNSLIKLTAIVAGFMVIPLVIAATLSQFSAAVADTIAASGTLAEVSKGKLNTKFAYLIIGIGAGLLTWEGELLEVVAWASRAFALYYALQSLVAITRTQSRWQKACFFAMFLILMFVTIFAVPAG